MKSITVHQPFGTLIATGNKLIENRTWPTKYRGPLGIHAGLSKVNLINTERNCQHRFGEVVAKTVLVACVELEKLYDEFHSGYNPNLKIEALGQYKIYAREVLNHSHCFGPWLWVLRDTEPVEPFPFKGQQGFFNIPDQLFKPERR